MFAGKRERRRPTTKIISVLILMLMLMLSQVAIAGDVFELSEQGDTNGLTLMLAKDPSLLNSRDKEGNTPIFHAVASKQEQMVKFMIARGANVNATDTNGVTPLHIAAVMGNGSIAGLLLDFGATVDAVTTQGITPLHWAAYYGNQEVAQVLIKHGAPVNAKEKSGNTPLHMAMRTRIKLSNNAAGKTEAEIIVNKEVAELLLKNGAQLNQVNEKGQTPLDFAIEQLNTPMADMLRKRGAKTHDDLRKP